MTPTETTQNQAIRSTEQQDLTKDISIEILHEREGGSMDQKMKAPLNVKIERVARGFKVVTSQARCM
jgi:hypothetical protein